MAGLRCRTGGCSEGILWILQTGATWQLLPADATLKAVSIPRSKGRPRQRPKRVTADRGYDSDPLLERWKQRGIELIAPYRKNNKDRWYEVDRKLRRYKRRWIIERANAWPGQFCRVLPALNISSPPAAPSSISLACGSPYGNVFESRSKSLPSTQ